MKILHRETKGIKFNGTLITSSELTNRNEILNYVRSNKHIIKTKRARPLAVTGRVELFPTMIDEGQVE